MYVRNRCLFFMGTRITFFNQALPKLLALLNLIEVIGRHFPCLKREGNFEDGDILQRELQVHLKNHFEIMCD